MFRLLILLIGASLWCSCTTTIPLTRNYPKPDYNNRIRVEGAYYHTQTSAVGALVLAGSAAAGGVGGYALNPIEVQSKGTTQSFPIVSGVMGAIIGYALPWTINQFLGAGTYPVCTDPDMWIKEKYPNYTILKKESRDHFVVIPKDQDRNYQVRNIQDVRDFRRVFSSSLFINDVFNTALYSIPDETLPELISLLPQAKNVEKAKCKYIEESSSIVELRSRLSTYRSATGLNWSAIISKHTDKCKSLADVDFLLNMDESTSNSYLLKNKKEELLSAQIAQKKNLGELLALYKQHTAFAHIFEDRLFQLANSISDYSTLAEINPSWYKKAESKSYAKLQEIDEMEEYLRVFSGDERALLVRRRLNNAKQTLQDATKLLRYVALEHGTKIMRSVSTLNLGSRMQRCELLSQPRVTSSAVSGEFVIEWQAEYYAQADNPVGLIRAGVYALAGAGAVNQATTVPMQVKGFLTIGSFLLGPNR